jgi:hypothetical protein
MFAQPALKRAIRNPSAKPIPALNTIQNPNCFLPTLHLPLGQRQLGMDNRTQYMEHKRNDLNHPSLFVVPCKAGRILELSAKLFQ